MPSERGRHLPHLPRAGTKARWAPSRGNTLLGLLQARALPGPGHLAQLEESHLQTRPGYIGKIQIKLFG
jgi:hypothetical protein